MQYYLSDQDLAAIKAVDSLLPLYVRLVAIRARHTDETTAYADHIQQARNQYASDDVEIDDDPSVSTTDEGTWVQAWLWVANDEVESKEDESNIPPILRKA